MKISYVIGDATEPIGDSKHKCIVHCCNNEGGWGSGFVVCLSKKWPHVEAAYRYWNAQSGRRPNKTEAERLRNLIDGSGHMYKMSGKFELGQIQLVVANPNIFLNECTYVCNLIGQHRTGIQEIAGVSIPPVDYRSIREGFARLKKEYLNCITNETPVFSLHMPRLGTGLAGGDWCEIEKILNEVFFDTDMDIFVYDLPRR